MGGLARSLAIVIAVVVSSCAPRALGAATDSVPDTGTLASASRAERAPVPRPVSARFFVASESTNEVWVLEGDPLAVVGRIPVGAFPHNISVSPDGVHVAVANRMGDTVSVIDPGAMREVARVIVPRQPHDLIWSPDARTIFVSSEREPYIGRIEAGTWRALAPLYVAVPQHALAISRDRPNELWFTVTNSSARDHLRVYDLRTGSVTPIGVTDVHDVFFTPDGSEVWTTSSGFLCRPSDRIVVYDPIAKTVKGEVHFAGHYPFHTIKQNRDATFFIDQTDTMVLSDHLLNGVLVVDWRERAIVRSASLAQPAFPSKGKCGIEPFHTAYTPGRYYITSNKDDSVRVVDAATMTILQRVEVTTPHGIVLVPSIDPHRAPDDAFRPGLH